MRSSPNATPEDPRSVAILARSLVREMREQGFNDAAIIGLTSELIDVVREGLAKDDEPAE